MTRNSSVDDLDLVAGEISLDLANTMSPRTGLRPRDHLRDDRDLLAWAVRAGALSAVEAEGFAKSSEGDVPASALEQVKALREAIYDVFSAFAAGRSPPATAFTTLSEAVERAATQRELRLTPQGGAIWRWRDARLDAAAIEHRLAWAAAELLVDPDKLARLKECPGENCGWLFVDRTKNGSRRWCSSRDCGNLSKVHDYRQRKAAGSAGDRALTKT